MIVSIAIAVLPVCRSPMISSRCPRPIGVIASIALIPVWSGSYTERRATMPGALSSTRRRSLERISPRPSIALPSAATTRPTSPSPTGTSRMRLVRRPRAPPPPRRAPPPPAAPALAPVRRLPHPGDADVVLLEVQHEPGDLARELDELARHHAVEPEDARDAVADREHGPRLRDVDLAVVLADLALQDVGDLTRLD